MTKAFWTEVLGYTLLALFWLFLLGSVLYFAAPFFVIMNGPPSAGP